MTKRKWTSVLILFFFFLFRFGHQSILSNDQRYAIKILPTIHISPTSHYTTIGSTVLLHCVYTTEHYHRILWFVNGSLVKKNVPSGVKILPGFLKRLGGVEGDEGVDGGVGDDFDGGVGGDFGGRVGRNFEPQSLNANEKRPNNEKIDRRLLLQKKFNNNNENQNNNNNNNNKNNKNQKDDNQDETVRLNYGFEGKSSLKIEDFKSFHVGVYRCMIEEEEEEDDDVRKEEIHKLEKTFLKKDKFASVVGQIRVVSEDCTLQIAEIRGDSLYSSEISTSAPLSTSALLPCFPPFSKPPAVLHFEKNGVLLTNRGERHTVLPSGNLQIWNLTSSDSATYQCMAVNRVSGVSVVASNKQILAVTDPPLQPQPPVLHGNTEEYITVEEGETMVLECFFSSWPLHNISWEKYGGSLPANRTSNLSGNLVIKDVVIFDAGTYLCQLDTFERKKVFIVEIMEKPQVRVSPAHRRVRVGGGARIRCINSGIPPPSISWWRDGVPLTRGEKIHLDKDNSLLLKDLVAADSGAYQCIGKNNVAMVTAASYLLVVAAGEEEDDDGYDDDDDDYGVDDYEDNEEEDDDGYLDIKDEDDYEDEEEEDEVPMNEGYQKPAYLPYATKPEIYRTSPTSLKVVWAVSPASPPHQVLEEVKMLKDFKIQLKEVSNNVWARWKGVVLSVPPFYRHYELQGLRKDATYKARIVTNFHHHPPFSSPASIQVKMAEYDVIPSTPTITRVSQLAASKVLVEWEMEQPDISMVNHFLISLHLEHDLLQTGNKYIKVTNRMSRSHKISNLFPGHVYNFRIFSVTSGRVISSVSRAYVMELTELKDGMKNGKRKHPFYKKQSGKRRKLKKHGDDHRFQRLHNDAQHTINNNNNNNNKTNVYFYDPFHNINAVSEKMSNDNKINNNNNNNNNNNSWVYALVGTGVGMFLLVTSFCLLVTMVKRKKIGITEKEKERLKEEGIERMKQKNPSSNMLLNNNTPTSNTATTIIKENYQIKAQILYTDSNNHNYADSNNHNYAKYNSPYNNNDDDVCDNENHIYSTLENSTNYSNSKLNSINNNTHNYTSYNNNIYNQVETTTKADDIYDDCYSTLDHPPNHLSTHSPNHPFNNLPNHPPNHRPNLPLNRSIHCPTLFDSFHHPSPQSPSIHSPHSSSTNSSTSNSNTTPKHPSPSFSPNI